ncbi:hypothetical protein C731_0783 [Mycolicibacterium hassiacum DSM 44199]|uniref:Uncharacterized protein n=1 Tax=Mycolicibacterium hassiacum (strain DSM 44199 / CIP 105218 / JCM 12690 / 3849) TaxID=1122247 RepID=K5BKN8_MYCHD|nr:hypothetical protein C731_0783 [Mycolicibacterium hassiacum DSM 44199]
MVNRAAAPPFDAVELLVFDRVSCGSFEALAALQKGPPGPGQLGDVAGVAPAGQLSAVIGPPLRRARSWCPCSGQ